MQWTMPRPVLQVVASLLVLAALAAFVTGLRHAPQRSGRLPGEKAASAASPSTAIEAQEATPLKDERIQGPPPSAAPVGNAPAGNAAAEAGANAAVAGAAAPGFDIGAAQPAPPKLPILKPVQPSAGKAPVQTLGGPPAPDEPPH